MIVSRTPLRVSLFGGGSDLPEFYLREDGCVLSFSINKYIYIASHNEFDGKFRLNYSKTEEVSSVQEIMHPIFRHTFAKLGIKEGIEIGSYADIPSRGSGLGSSSAFTVGLIANLLGARNENLSQSDIAAMAYDIERNQIGDSVGKQDHYGTSIGGIKRLTFMSSGEVSFSSVSNSERALRDLPKHLRLVYTGIPRSANDLLQEQGLRTLESKTTYNIIRDLRDFVDPGQEALENGQYELVGEYLNSCWEIKKRISEKISLEHIDSIYSNLLENGIWGAKLLGAGGGGFLIGIGDPQAWARYTLRHPSTRVLSFEIDLEGVSTYAI